MNVYLVTVGMYDGYDVACVCSTRAKAERAAEQIDQLTQIEERPVDCLVTFEWNDRPPKVVEHRVQI